MKYSVLFCTVILATPLAAQAPTASPEHQAKMEAVQFLAGQWRGSAAMRMGPGDPQRVDVVERVEPRLDGLVLVIEGVGTTDLPGREDAVVHHAFAVLSYDSQDGHYLMRAFKRDGNYVDADITVDTGVIVWGMSVGEYGTVRYTIKLNQAGQWSETGEISRDGETWAGFFEMTLDKVEETE